MSSRQVACGWMVERGLVEAGGPREVAARAAAQDYDLYEGGAKGPASAGQWRSIA